MARLVATDLDGTLLRSDGTVSARARTALRAAHDDGRVVVLATGRPIRFVRDLAVDLRISAPVVCANGAITYDATADEIVLEETLPLETYEHLLATLRERFDGLTFGVETGRVFSCEQAFADLAVWPMPPGSVAAEGVPLCAVPPAKILVRHPSMPLADAYEAIVEAVGDLASVTHSTSTLLEIAAPGVDKGAGLARLAAEIGIEAEDVVAFGDMPNDVGMLAWAGRGVAVENAHPAVLEVADEVTASNDDDGVARVVELLDALDASDPDATRSPAI